MTPIPSTRFAHLVDVPEPSQARSRDALERLLRAGEALMAENRFEEAGVADLAKLAQTSVGTFYRVLGDKETLSRLLLQRFFHQVMHSVDAMTQLSRWQSQPLEAFGQELVAMFVATYQGRRGVLRAMITRASRDAQFRDRVHQLNQYVAQRTMAVLASKAEAITHPDPTLAMMAVVPMVLGVLNHHTLTGALGFLSDEALQAEIGRLFNAYLGIRQLNT